MPPAWRLQGRRGKADQKGYRLLAKFVIHTVGPVWRDGRNGEQELLESCYCRSLELADAHKIKSIAFPCISTGIYGYPIEKAAQVAVSTVSAYMSGTTGIGEVVFCCFSASDLSVYERLLSTGFI